jgi:FimV-like protein
MLQREGFMSRKLKKNWGIFLFLFLWVGLPAQAQNVQQILDEANQKFDNHEEADALELYARVIKLQPENHEALWKGSFLSARVGNRLETESEQKKYFYRAMTWAEKALATDSTDVNSYYAMGVALGRMALILPAKERVAGTRKIERIARKGLSIDPDHAGLNHVLGFLYYKLANASNLEKMAAKMLFGGIPKDASNERAITYISKAVDNHSSYLLYHMDLARAYHANGQDSLAREQLNQVISLPGYSPDDPDLKAEAREMMKELS